jgi:hypothetical protein
MKRIEHTILKKPIQSGSLVSLTSQNWYDYNGNLTPWSGSAYIGPSIGDGVYNFTGSVDNRYSSSVAEGYYKWGGTTWISTSLTGISESYNLPIFLESTVDEMGVMVSFDGGVEQIEQLCNFTYTQSGSMVTVYNSVNPDKLRKIVESEFTIEWGDGSTSGLTVNSGVVGQGLPSKTHTYTGTTGYTISLSLDSPWTQEKISKNIIVPQNISVANPLGTFTGITIPSYTNITGQTENYLNNLDYTNNTGNTISGFTYMAIGKSRINELKQYGTSSITGMSTGTTEGSVWSGYTIDGLYYRDFPDNYTMITGTTTGFTKEEVFNNMITRNEHFLGFIDDPTIYSDIFVERGRQGVMENNLRLGEIDNMSELDVYGNGYFNVKKQ